ncbi:hypothetical protein [uncultured Solobacterium sp.]|uniref:hypothetical protein n=1 Tax=uncultured Solobacterium sp. TaxID=747375 RepID=UPI0028EAF928|nr:hypothetical protein [uncultured Solobacterium sp.]
MNKKKLFIIVSILAAIGLVVMLFVLPKPKTNNTAKQETSSETSSSKESSKKNDKKDDKKDNKQSDKKDSKKDDKKEDKKEDTSTTSSETPVTPTTGTTTTETQNNNNSSSVTNTPSTNTTPAAPAPQPIYQTIHHDAVGHWETQVIQEEWDQPIYERKIIGNQTGRVYNSLDEFSMQDDDGGYHVGDVQVGTTHHDAVTQQVWVVDQEAWDQTVIVGYR